MDRDFRVFADLSLNFLTSNQALMMASDGAARLVRNGATIEAKAVLNLIDSPEARNPLFARILAFDGKRALLAQHRWLLPKDLSQWSVEVLNADDLSRLARYDTSEEVHSVTVVGTRLVFGMNGAVSVADPECRAP